MRSIIKRVSKYDKDDKAYCTMLIVDMVKWFFTLHFEEFWVAWFLLRLHLTCDCTKTRKSEKESGNV